MKAKQAQNYAKDQVGGEIIEAAHENEEFSSESENENSENGDTEEMNPETAESAQIIPVMMAGKQYDGKKTDIYHYSKLKQKAVIIN